MLKSIRYSTIFTVALINLLFATDNSFAPTTAHVYLNATIGAMWLGQLNLSLSPYKHIFVQTGGSGAIIESNLNVLAGYQISKNDDLLYRIGAGYLACYTFLYTETEWNALLFYASCIFFPLHYRKLGFSVSLETGISPKPWNNPSNDQRDEFIILPSLNVGIVFTPF